MVTMLSVFIFGSALVASVLVIAAMIAPQWQRIVTLLRDGFDINPVQPAGPIGGELVILPRRAVSDRARRAPVTGWREAA